MSYLAEGLEGTVAKDLAYLFVGQELGHGMSRTAYTMEHDKTVIVKREVGGGFFQNIREWEIWKEVKDTPFAKWFAPCVDISPNGIFLIQKRVTIVEKDRYPELMPKFFTDFKYQNYGILGKQFVCFDYGTMPLLGSLTKGMKKADWWDADN